MIEKRIKYIKLPTGIEIDTYDISSALETVDPDDRTRFPLSNDEVDSFMNGYNEYETTKLIKMTSCKFYNAGIISAVVDHLTKEYHKKTRKL